MINFIIPMAGKGKRFFDAGFKVPKWKLNINNKTLLQHSIASLPLEICSNLIFIYLKEDDDLYNIKKFIKDSINFDNILTISLENATNSQLETVLKIKNYIDSRKKILIFNIDTFFSSNTLVENLQKNPDGLIGGFQSDSKNYSFAKLKNNRVIETAEKKVISNIALSGLYYFKSYDIFHESSLKLISDNFKVNNEYYIAPIYNYLIRDNKEIILDMASKIDIIGTPEEYYEYKKNN